MGALAGLLAASPLAGQSSVEVVKVADGVFAVHPPAAQRFDESNAAVVIREDGVLVVDTQTAPPAARAVIAEIRKLTDKPVRWVVNTHWHGDHVQGNSAYRDAFPEVQFLAQVNTAEDIENRAQPQLAQDIADAERWLERGRKALETGEADGQKLGDEEKKEVAARIEQRSAHLVRLKEVNEFVLPTKTFDAEFDLPAVPAPAGAGAVHMRHYAGHTRGDVALHLARERVLITGDLLDDLPFTGHGSPQALVETLRSFEKLEFDAIIPGHGRVRRGEEARTHLKKTIELFDSIVSQARAGVAAGLNVEDTAAKVDVDAMREYFVTDDASKRYWSFFVSEAVARAYDEAKKTPAQAPAQ